MKERFINGGRAVVTNHQAAKVAEPGEGAFDFPAAAVAAQGSTVLRARLAAIAAMRRDQFDASRSQLRAQRIAVISAVSDHATHCLTRPSAAMPAAYADRRERFF